MLGHVIVLPGIAARAGLGNHRQSDTGLRTKHRRERGGGALAHQHGPIGNALAVRERVHQAVVNVGALKVPRNGTPGQFRFGYRRQRWRGNGKITVGPGRHRQPYPDVGIVLLIHLPLRFNVGALGMFFENQRTFFILSTLLILRVPFDKGRKKCQRLPRLVHRHRLGNLAPLFRVIPVNRFGKFQHFPIFRYFHRCAVGWDRRVQQGVLGTGCRQ